MTTVAIYYLPSYSPSTPATGVRKAGKRVRRWIDPTTRDYVVQDGDLRQDDGFASKVVLALGTRLGTCQVLPSFGSRLHEIKRADELGRKLAEKRARSALAHLESEVDELTVTAALNAKAPGLIDITVTGKRGANTTSAVYTSRVGK